MATEQGAIDRRSSQERESNEVALSKRASSWNRCKVHPDKLTRNPGGELCGTCIVDKYRKKNPERFRLTRQIHYLNNSDSINEKERARYAKFPYTHRDAARAYYERAREALLTKRRERARAKRSVPSEQRTLEATGERNEP